MVFQRSMLNWRRRGVHLPNMSTMCFLLYMKLIWCNGFPEIYAQLEEGVHLPNMSTMCILLYMKLIWCHGFPEIYAQLEEGAGPVCCETYAV